MNKRISFMDNTVPQEVLDSVQVVIVTMDSVHFIAPQPYKMVIYESKFTLPKVTCPIVHLETVIDDDQAIARVTGQTIDRVRGVKDLPGLLDGLQKLGATVENASVQ